MKAVHEVIPAGQYLPVVAAAAAVLTPLRWGYVIAGGFLVLLGFWLIPGGRWKRALKGADNRLSTSKFQAFLWTLGIATALSVMSGIVLFDDSKRSDILTKDLRPEYLLLLGGPFAAAVGAKAIVSGKIENGELQKVTAPDIQRGITSDDAGSIDLVDTQYLAFNLVTLTYFAMSFFRNPFGGLPPLPDTLVGLTSVSALTYVANKAALRNAPQLNAISPTSGAPGDVVEIFGRHFVPGGAPSEGERGAKVLFGGVRAPFELDSSGNVAVSDTSIRVRVPEGIQGLVDVQVLTAAEAKTDPVRFEVRPAPGRCLVPSSAPAPSWASTNEHHPDPDEELLEI